MAHSDKAAYNVVVVLKRYYINTLKQDLSTAKTYEHNIYISQLIRFARVCSKVDDFNNRNIFLTAKLLKQGYRYHEIRKAFSKFYH